MWLKTYFPITHPSLARALPFVAPASSRLCLLFRESGGLHRSPATGPLAPMGFSANTLDSLIAGHASQSCLRLSVSTLAYRLSRREHFCSNAPRSLLYFHTLTNCFPRNRFALIFLQIAGGCHPLDAARERNCRCRAKLNLFCFMPLRALLRSAKVQLACFHSLAHSFRKTTGVGGTQRFFRETEPVARVFRAFQRPAPLAGRPGDLSHRPLGTIWGMEFIRGRS